jgi:actin-like ATPase involved in cell morphogenesis
MLPSCVGISPTGQLLVGQSARNQLLLYPEMTIRSVKRKMGTDEKIVLGDKSFSPQEISALILRELAEWAAKELGRPVKKAVVTVPAYFSDAQRQATREAGEMAGLEVLRILNEPTAASLAYGLDQGTRKTVMIYDLGGGTFDITVLQRAGGKFIPLAFGGDAELGGYNFDKALANYMLAELRRKGYQLKIDPDKPEKDARWARLMQLAEEVKWNLSREGQRGLKADISEPRLFLDDDPKTVVQLKMSITRDQFEEMIRKHIDHTIACCHEVLTKAKLGFDQIHRPILVGGSTRLPIVQWRLQEEFGRPFEFDGNMVDLCVAIGAALVADAEPRTVAGFRLMPIPDATEKTSIVVAGAAEPNPKAPVLEQCVAVLAQEGQSPQSQKLNAEGSFYFEATLARGATHPFTLKALTAENVEFAGYAFTVVQGRSSGPPPPPLPPTYLAKSLFVETRNLGMVEIIREGAPLPVDITVDGLVTASKESTKVNVELYQGEGELHLATVPLKDFSKPVPEGTKVILKVHVGRDYSMSARVDIPINGAFKTIDDIKIPQPPRPKVEELQREFARCKREADQYRDNTPAGDKKIQVCGQIDKIVDEVETLLKDTEADIYRIQRLLKSLDRLIKPSPASAMRPSREEMGDLFAKARALLPEAEAKDPSVRSRGYAKTLDQLAVQADEAYAREDARTWATVAAHVKEIIGAFDRLILPPPPPPKPEILLMQLQHAVRELEAEGRAAGLADRPEFTAALSQARNDIKQVNLGAPDALNQVISIIQGSYSRLEAVVKGIRIDDKKPEDGTINGPIDSKR